MHNMYIFPGVYLENKAGTYCAFLLGKSELWDGTMVV